MIERIQKRFALTKIGAKNLVKACISCTVSYLVIAMSIQSYRSRLYTVDATVFTWSIVEAPFRDFLNREFLYIVECIIHASTSPLAQPLRKRSNWNYDFSG